MSYQEDLGEAWDDGCEVRITNTFDFSDFDRRKKMIDGGKVDATHPYGIPEEVIEARKQARGFLHKIY